MHDGHQRLGNTGGIGVLNDVAAIDDARGALLDELFGPAQDFLVRGPAAAPHQHGDFSGNLNHLVIGAHVLRRVGLDDVGA